MRHQNKKTRDWGQLPCIVALGLVVGCAISITTKFLTPAMVQAKTTLPAEVHDIPKSIQLSPSAELPEAARAASQRQAETRHTKPDAPSEF